MIFNREPALILGVLQAVLALCAAFALPLSGNQVGAVMAVASALVAVLVRSQVYSPATVEKIKSDLGAPEA